MNIGILILRLFVGLALAAHGAQKAFGWFGGPGFAGATGFMARLGHRPARLWALAAVSAEIGGGLLFALGLLSPLGSLGILAAMLVVILGVHLPKGFFNTNGGIELPLIGYLVPAVAVMFTGAGDYSVDHLLGISLPEPVAAIAGIVLVLIGVGLAFASKSTAAPTQHQGRPSGTPQPQTAGRPA